MAWLRGLSVLVAVFLLQIGAGAQAKVKIEPPAPLPENLQTTITDAEYEKILAAAKKSRKVASESDTFDYVSAYSDDAKNIQARIIGGSVWKEGKETSARVAGIQKAADIDVLIKDLEANYEQLQPDAKFMAAFWISLKPWKAFIQRARPLVERHNLSQSAIVTFMRATYASINVFVPDTPAWKAGFDYVTMPSADMGPDISNESQLYHFASSQILPALDAFNARIYKLNFEAKPIYFDNKVLVRSANFVSTRDRHVRLGEAERLSVLAGGLLAYSNLAGAMAYSWDGFFKAVDNVGTVYGFNSKLNDGSMTAARRFQEIKEQSSLFKLRPDGPGAPTYNRSKEWTKNVAFVKFKEGLRAARASWTWLKKNAANDDATRNIFDPRAFIPFTRIIDTSFDNIDSLLHDRGIASAVVNGQAVDINFKLMFEDPPLALTEFFPVEFEGGQNKQIDPITRKQYRNYNYGNPKGWNIGAYQKYFPNVKNNEDVKQTARVLNQAWGGWLLGIPIAGMTM
ncbi:MAG TPA: hypothetical protein VFV50_11750 [Bdellovibrionales bacterium]|nr:hypothetical protein [Bdellovibrionales bacterium]